MTTTITTVEVPKLDHDAMMLAKFNVEVSTGGRLERRIVANLVAHLEAAGFAVNSVYDGEEFTKCSTAKEAMELIFNLDEASLRFVKKGYSEHGVLLIIGNGIDILCDWSYSDDDADGFNAAMDAFDVDAFA